MAEAQQTEEQNPGQALVEANLAMINTVLEAGYKVQARTMNVGRVFIEAAGRQQESARKVIEQLVNPSLPWYSPERFNAYVSLMTENQNEVLRIGREYIDELNAAAAEGRQTLESLAEQAGKVREAQQALYGQGFAQLREFTNGFQRQSAA